MEIIWSNIATKHLESILEYVEYEFGENTAAKTLSKHLGWLRDQGCCG